MTEASSYPELKKTVLLLHGFMGSGEDWQFLPASFGAAHSFLCPDLPGHGSAWNRNISPALNLDTVLLKLSTALDSHGAESCALVGYSLGGRIALHLALRYPRRFSCLVLISASPGIEDPRARTQRQKADEQLARQLDTLTANSTAFQTFLLHWYRQPVFTSLAEKPLLTRTLITRRMQNSPPALAQCLRSLGAGTLPSLWNRLSELNMPVLLIAGKDDPKYVGISSRMHALLPAATLEILDHSGHCPHLEVPETCRDTVAAFLRRHC